MNTMIHSEYSIEISASYEQTTVPKTVPHPEWNPKKVYNYLEDMGEGFREYKSKAVAFYRSDFAAKDLNKAVTIDELKKMISDYFPKYKFTDREPDEPVAGSFYLYIDKSQLGKMAANPAYRAQVFGLIDSELQGSKGYTLKHCDGRNITHYITGSIFSLAEANFSIDGVGMMPGSDGIPYHGSGIGSVSCSSSPAQVRSQSYIEQVLHPGKYIASREAAEGIHAPSAEELRAQQRRNEHKLEVRMRYREWLEDKTEADMLQEQFMTDISDFEEKLTVFDTSS